MECKFKSCSWNKKGICKRKNSITLFYDEYKTNIVRCSKYQKRTTYKNNNKQK